MSLPIQALHKDFTRALQDPAPLVVHAPTGSGKSTQLPQWLQQQRQGPIIVVEPRRIACRALAGFLAEQRGESVGQSIGYRVRFESRVSEQTQIEFVTPGVALRLLQSSDAEQIKGWMLDEFHERSWETDLLLACLRQKRAQDPFALVLTSATLEGAALSDALGAQLLQAQGRAFPVKVAYEDDPAQPSDRDLAERVEQIVRRVLREHPQDQGDILVFLPGKAEIERCRQQLRSLQQQHDIDLLPLHGALPSQQLMRALSPKAPKRRVYLSTNVAETSLTLPGVTTVIDSGLARMRIHRGGHSALALIAIAEAQMDQRSGRAGRVAAGRCIRMWSARYQADPSPQPEIERIEVDDLVLQAVAVGLPGNHLAEAPWLTPPPTFALERALQRLRELDALDEQGALTSTGRDLARWPIPAQDAYLLLGAPPELSPVLADLLALMQQSRSDLLLPLHRLPTPKQQEIHDARLDLLEGCPNEVFVQLLCLRQGHPQRHGLHDLSLQQARKIASQLRQRLRAAHRSPTQDPAPLPQVHVLARWLLQRAPERGFVLRERAQKPKKTKRRKHEPTTQPWANGEIEVMWEPFQGWGEAPIEPARAGIILQVAWLAGRGLQVRGKGRMLLPCPLLMLAEAGLGEENYSQPTTKRDPKGRWRVVAQVEQIYAGVTLHRTEKPIQGEALREALVALIQRGSLRKGLWDTLLDRFHLLKLAHEWPAWEIPPLPEDLAALLTEPAQWLQQQMTTHGLEQAEEIDLLEDEDLLPDLFALTGLDPMTLDQLRDDFPRCWDDHGALYLCHVRPKSQRVIIEPTNANAKKASPPPEKRLPRFRGFHVDYQKASRRLTLRGNPRN